MTLRHLKLFIAAADAGSITAAARQLYIAQPTVSIAVKELEEHYGICLFERISKRLRITEDGRRFLDYARHIVRLFDEMEQLFTDPERKGSLRLGASVTVGIHYVPEMVKKLETAFSGLRVQVQIDSSDEIERKILKKELDLAVIDGVVHSEYLTSYPRMEDRLIPVCAPGYVPEELSLSELVEKPLLLRERKSGAREIFENALAIQGYKAEPAWESTSTEALKNAAQRGIGIAFLPEKLVWCELQEGTLAQVQVVNLEIRRVIHMIYHRNKFISEAMGQWIEMIRESQWI